MSRTVAAILAAWIIVPVLFLTRHYACLSGSQSAACTVFVLAVHLRHHRDRGDFAFSSYLDRSGLAVPLVMVSLACCSGGTWLHL